MTLSRQSTAEKVASEALLTPLQLEDAKKAEAKRLQLARKLVARGYRNTHMGVDRPVPAKYCNNSMRRRRGDWHGIPLIAQILIAFFGLLILALLVIAAVVVMLYLVVRQYRAE